MDNNYVAMERLMCPICGETHQHKAGILIDKHFKNIPEDKTTTGYGLCKQDDERCDEGYLAMIVVSNDEPSIGGNTLKFNKANRTGEILYIREQVYKQLINIDAKETPFMFISVEAAEEIKELVNQDKETMQ